MKRTKTIKLPTMTTLVLLAGTGCASLDMPSSLDLKGLIVGPTSVVNAPAETVPQERRPDVVVTEMDPGLPDDPDDYEAKGIWPELRRAEGRKFALDMREALYETEHFGDIWVAPDARPMSDLYVLGSIVESNGEDVRIRVEVRDSTNRRWLSKTYSHRVKEAWHADPRNSKAAGLDGNPYAPVFRRAAKDIVKKLRSRDTDEIEEIREVADIRFGHTFAPEAFEGYLARGNGRLRLTGTPARDDPMLARTNAVRVRERMFLDGMQTQYEAFGTKMDAGYRTWQAQAMSEAKNARRHLADSVVQGVVGGVVATFGTVLAIGGALASDGTGDAAALTGGIAMAAGGFGMVSGAFKSHEQARVHRSAYNELSQSLNLSVAPRNVLFEGEVKQLHGTMAEQYGKWQGMIQKIWELEKVPDTEL